MSLKKLTDMPLSINPSLPSLYTPEEEEQLRKLRKYVFEKYKTDDGYRCACCGKIFKRKIDMVMYVIEELDIDGVTVWQSSDGGIYELIPGSSPEKIAGSIAEYLGL